MAFVTYVRLPDRPTYNYIRYFYGQYRRTHPVLFWGIFVAFLLGFVGNVAANVLARAELPPSATTPSPARPPPR